MKIPTTLRYAILAGAIVAGPVSLRADESALLDLLVRKHLLTEKEAAQVQDESARIEAGKDASEIKLSNAVSEMRIYGDIRERYQYDELQNQFYAPVFTSYYPYKYKTQNPAGNQESRWRFRLRLDADFKLGEQWFGGVELSTNYSSTDSNQTYGYEFSKDAIYISKAFLGYRPTEAITFEIGKFSNPFYTTDLVWDPDLNPEGLYEQLEFHKLFAGGHSGKPLPWELTLVAGQLVYSDNPEGGRGTNPIGSTDPGATISDYHTDGYVFETQLIASYNASWAKFTVAPAWFVENAAALRYPNTPVYALNSRKLSELLLPGDVSFTIGGVKTKLYWDASYNFEGKGRFKDVYYLGGLTYDYTANNIIPITHGWQDNLAWLAGLQIGQNAKAGDFSFLADWRQTGISSVDPNLHDSDFAFGYLNTQGYRLALAYNLTDFAVFQITWSQAWNFRKNLIGGEAAPYYGTGVANANSAKVLQVDLNVKF